MAGKQQKTTGRGRKSTSSKKNSTKKSTGQKNKQERMELTPEEREQQAGIRDEVVLVSMLAVSIILVLSNFDLCGKVGEIISNITFGLFGFMAYLLPIGCFIGFVFMIANRNNRAAKVKMIAAVFGFLLMTIFVHMLTEPFSEKVSILEAYSNSAAGRDGGGLIGGAAVAFLHPLLGTVGCYVLVIALFMICVVLVTQRSIFIPLGRKGKDAYSKASEHHREQVRIRKEEREAKRQMEAQKHEDVDIQSQLASGDLNFDLGVAAMNAAEGKEKGKAEPWTPESDSPSVVKDEASVSKSKKTRVTKKPLVDDIEEEIILPAEDELSFTVNRMEPLKTSLEDIPYDFGVPQDETINSAEGDMHPIVIDAASVDMAEDFDENKIQQIPPVKNIVKKNIEPIAVKPSDSAIAKASAKAEAMKAEAPSEAENQMTAEEIETALEQKPEYVFPPLSLLMRGEVNTRGNSDEELRQTALKLKNTLDSFGVKVQVTNVSCGPTVTRYELQPDQGVKVSRIVNLSDDIKLNLAVADIRIEAPIPGKAAIGIEVPNKENTAVMLRDLLESQEFQNNHSGITFAAGRDIGGKVILADIAKMPHLLIAGATGSGKSVCINTLIMSIIYKAKPEDVRMIMIDPKVVELSVYNGIPHLLIPVVTDPKKAAGALNWAVMEMTDRYKKFAELHVRDLKGYNEKVSQTEIPSPDYPRLPQIVIIVDELADLMMVAPGEVEDAICRLAQLARACGIHLVIATQRPSVNVITGVIKANIPSRIAFSVSSSVDSRTIIDMGGAEKLLGKGDMLFYPSGYQKPLRVQGAFVSDEEVNAVVEFLRESQNGYVNYNEDVTSKITSAGSSESANSAERDVYFVDAGKFIIEKDKASIGMLQRVFKIGFNRAARIMDQLYEAGVVGPEEGTKPRKVLMSEEQFEAYIEEYV